MKLLCTICARAGSKGVRNKNIRNLAGKPLIAHSIEQAIECRLFEHIVVSTDSEEISKISQDHGAEVFFKRSPELSTDHAGKLDVIRDAFTKSEEHFKSPFDVLIDLDATSPLRSPQDIVNAYKQFTQNKNSNLITAMNSRRSPYFNLVELNQEGQVHLSKELDSTIVRRQDSPKTYDLNASIYIWNRESILNQESLFCNKTGLYIMPEERSIDIDSELDFDFVSFIFRHNLRK